jgi:hypothetical protein
MKTFFQDILNEMRNLNIDEISDKINDYSSDIRYSDIIHIDYKMDQFLNFLFQQLITLRITQRIEDEFKSLNQDISNLHPNKSKYSIETELKNLLLTREIQGAFAYFEIKNKFSSSRRVPINHYYINLSHDWYHFKFRGAYSEFQDYFYIYFLEPFIELLKCIYRKVKSKTIFSPLKKGNLLKIKSQMKLKNWVWVKK